LADEENERTLIRELRAWDRSRVSWLVFLVALVEVVGIVVIRTRVPEEDDWERAAAFVDDAFEDGDTIVGAPDWADPLLREHLGDRIPLSHAGRSDLAPFERLWELSIRGHRSLWAPEDEPELDRVFGRVRVRRWDLGPSPVVFDLTSRIEEATVTRGPRRCTWRRRGPQGGGLGRGPLWPGEHHFCGPEPWMLVGETVNEDLELRPRHCVWQHPAANEEPVRTTFRNVPLGERVVLYAGIYYEHERMREHGPATVRVLQGDTELGHLTHQDGDGWERLEAETHPLDPERTHGDLTVEVTSPLPHLRTVCWSATTRGPRRERE